MALNLADRVLETASAPGTGAVTLLGAVTGYRTFSSTVGNGNTCYYTIADQSGANWECGIGTYATSGNTLTRTTILSSSNAGSTVNFATGTQNVFVTYPSEKAVYLDASGNVQPSLGTATFSSVTDSGLTSGRVTYATTGGLLTDSANLTFSGTNLTIKGGNNNSLYIDNGGTQYTSAYWFNNGTQKTGIYWDNTNTLYYIDNQTANGQNIYNAGSNGTHRFTINSTEAMRIDSSGNVGIGTSSPTTKLQVAGNLTVNAGGGNTYGQFISGSSTIQVGTNGTSQFIYGTGAVPLTFSVNAGEAMRIDSSGSVGIGVTPDAWDTAFKVLQIQTGSVSNLTNDFIVSSNSSYYSGNFRYIASTSAAQYTLACSTANPYHAWSTAASGTAGNAITFTERMRIDSSGNVGIGTSSITSVSTYKVLALNGSSSNGGYISLQTSGTEQGNIYSNSSGTSISAIGATYLSSWTNGSERMRIDSSGNVGINTTNMLSKLTVNNSYISVGSSANTSQTNILLQGYGFSNSATIYGNTSIRSTYDNASNSASLEFYTSSGYTNTAERMRIDTSGNVGIGTSSPSAKLQVVGGEAFRAVNDAAYMSFFNTANSTRSGYLQFQSSGVCTLSVDVSQPLTFQTVGTERVRIDTSGNVGIGTSSPSTYGKLAINGNTTIINGGSLYLYNTGNTAYAFIGSPATNVIGFNNSTLGETMRITSNGQVLIGTATSPTTSSQIPLVVSTSGSPPIKFYSNNSASMSATCGITTTTYGSGKYAGYQLIANGTGMFTNSSSGSTNFLSGASGIYFGSLNQDPFENASTTYTEYAHINSGGLTFVSSNSGIIFNNASALTNSTLNDYETGYWTPVITNGTTNVTSYFWQIGTYTKIGNQVFISMQISVQTIGITSGNIYITGLPFAMAQTSVGSQTITALNGFKYSPTGATTYEIMAANPTYLIPFLTANFPTQCTYADLGVGGQWFLNGSYTATF